jgi:hypothetical protein
VDGADRGARDFTDRDGVTTSRRRGTVDVESGTGDVEGSAVCAAAAFARASSSARASRRVSGVD